MPILFTTITAIGLGGLLYSIHAESRWVVIVKAVASAGFVALALSRDATASRYGLLILVGLGLGLLGDVLLEWQSPAGFLLGLGAFMLGHLSYLAGFVLDGPVWRLAGIAMAVLLMIGIGVAVWLHLHLPAGLVTPVRFYIFVTAAMTAAAIGLISQRPLASVGAVTFFLSDLTVARDRFVHPAFLNHAIGLPLYYLAQVLLAWSI